MLIGKPNKDSVVLITVLPLIINYPLIFSVFLTLKDGYILKTHFFRKINIFEELAATLKNLPIL